MDFSAVTSSLPITDPTGIFFIVLCIILFAPIILGRLHIPNIIGMLLAGVIVGPYGIGLLQRDSSFEIFGNVGLLYIMFLAGVEMNLSDFRKYRNKTIVFGLFTFLLPFTMGFLACHYLLAMSWLPSLLVASMLSSHTLISYTIASRYGVTKNIAVNVAVGGTMITDMLSLLVLAIVSRTVEGTSGIHFWLILVGSILIFVSAVLYLFPLIERFFFRRVSDQVLQFVFVLVMLFLAALGAHIAGLEGILGAFLAGIALNRLIPTASPLMNRLTFVGNALFIPYFLIGVGMLIDLRAFFHGPKALIIAGVLTLIGVLGKYLAAWIPGMLFKMSRSEKSILFGLSASRTAATLAVVMVGYKLALFDDNILNATLVLILLTCIISSFVVERSARQLATTVEIKDENNMEEGKCLISYANTQTVDDLTQIAIMLRAHDTDSLIGLHVVYNNEQAGQKQKLGQLNLQKAAQIAASVDVPMTTLSRVSTNIVTGIIHTMLERDASEVVIGMHYRASIVDSVFGSMLENLLQSTHKQVMVVKCLVPVNTLKRIVVAVPSKAEYERGFYKWVTQLCRMSEHLGCRIHFFAHPDTIQVLRGFIEKKLKDVRSEYSELENWDDLLLITGHVDYDYLLVIVSSRHGFISYRPAFEKLPAQIAKYLNNSSLIVLYPEQHGDYQDIVPYFGHVDKLSDVATSERHTNWLTKWIRRTNG